MQRVNRKKEKFFLDLVKQGKLVVPKSGKVYNAETGHVYTAVSGGYPRINWLNKETGKVMNMLTHRLVWLVHKGPIPDELEINHKDKNTENPRLSNLELATGSENVKHAFANGKVGVKGSQVGTAKLDEDKVARMRRQFRRGVSVKRLVRHYKVSSFAVRSALTGKQWGHVPNPISKDEYKLSRAA